MMLMKDELYTHVTLAGEAQSAHRIRVYREDNYPTVVIYSAQEDDAIEELAVELYQHIDMPINVLWIEHASRPEGKDAYHLVFFDEVDDHVWTRPRRIPIAESFVKSVVDTSLVYSYQEIRTPRVGQFVRITFTKESEVQIYHYLGDTKTYRGFSIGRQCLASESFIGSVHKVGKKNLVLLLPSHDLVYISKNISFKIEKAVPL